MEWVPPRYGPWTTFHEVPEEHVEDVIETVGLPATGWERRVAYIEPREHRPILSSIKASFQRPVDEKRSLSPLEMLPTELIHQIMLYLDMRSVFKLRQQSVTMRRALDSSYHYELVATYGLDLFCILLRSSLASRVSLSDFYKILCHSACRYCRRFGPIVSLWSWTRSCYKCRQFDCEVAYGSEGLFATMAPTWPSDDDAEDQSDPFPLLKPFCASLGPNPVTLTGQGRRDLAMAVDGQYQITKKQEEDTPYLKRDKSKPTIRFPVGFCALPFYDEQRRTAEHGLLCLGCVRAWIPKSVWKRELPEEVLFTRRGLLKHFEYCNAAQLHWKGGLKLSNLTRDLKF